MKKGVKDFEYLVGMPISTLTKEKVDELMRLHDTKLAEMKALQKKTIEALWLDDLATLERALDERDAQIAEEARTEASKLEKARAKAGKGGGKGAGRQQRGTKRVLDTRAPDSQAPQKEASSRARLRKA